MPIPPGTRNNATIRYTLSRGDWLRWHIYVAIRQRVLVGLLIIAGTFYACLNLNEPELATRSLAFKIAFVVFFDLIFLSFALVLHVLLLGLTMLLSKHRGLVGEHVLEVGQDGLFESTDVNESLHRWAGFHRIKTTRNYIYLYVTDALVHIVPLRCFSSPDEAKAFLHEIHTHIKDS